MTETGLVNSPYLMELKIFTMSEAVSTEIF